MHVMFDLCDFVSW